MRHPRLAALTGAGATVFAASMLLYALSGPPEVRTLAVRGGVVGFLLMPVGGAGYVSFVVFEHRPGERQG